VHHSLPAAYVWDLCPANPSLHDGPSTAWDGTWASSGTAGGAANKEPALRAELDALSGLSFIDVCCGRAEKHTTNGAGINIKFGKIYTVKSWD
jgi:hypothetical protein